MPGTNLLLESLSPGSRDFLLSHSKMIEMPVRKVIYHAESAPLFACFLTSGIASVVASMENGAAAEVGMIGFEGLVGAVHLLGPAKAPTDCFMQTNGDGYRISFADLSRAFEERRDVRSRVLEFVQEQAMSLGQIAGCHRLHEAEERLARWLLMAQDRIVSDVLVLTQEFLAEMLGSRRTTVTIAAGILQRAGIIEYTRGRVRILSREQLEATACGCYQIVKKLQANLYATPVRERGPVAEMPLAVAAVAPAVPNGLE